jgi:hypothetical protein
VWPVQSLTLGTVTYSESQLCAILNTPVVGNGLIDLAHQLIAAELNIANGADPSSIQATIDLANAMIGNLVVGTDTLPTSQTSPLVAALDAFNTGTTGPGHCPTPTPTPTPCAVAEAYGVYALYSPYYATITLGWGPVPGAAAYQLLLDGTPFTGVEAVNQFGQANLTYTIYNVNPCSGDWTFSVAAINSCGTGAVSASVTVSVPCP